MHTRNWFAMGGVLIAAIVAVGLFRQALWWRPAGKGGAASPGAGLQSGAERAEPAGVSLEFGPATEAVLHEAGLFGDHELLDLESGRRLSEPDPEHAKMGAREAMAWIRNHGLDISCSIWRGGAGCITYDMRVIPVEARCWEQESAQQLVTNRLLAPHQSAPRRLLVLGQGHPDTYLFRTGEGTLGMLRLAGLSADGRGVRICYKLVEGRRNAVSPGQAAERLALR